MALMWCRLWQLNSISEPARPQPGWVCAAWCSQQGLARTWQHLLLLWEPSVPPLTTFFWPHTGVLTGGNLLLWLCLAELSGCFICFSHLHPDHSALVLKSSQFRKLSRLNLRNLSFFSCSLSLLLFLLELRELWCQITPSWLRDPQPHATRIWV